MGEFVCKSDQVLNGQDLVVLLVVLSLMFNLLRKILYVYLEFTDAR